MKKFALFAGVGIGVILVVMALTFYFIRQHTKSFSPEEEVTFAQGDLHIRVFYNRPYKKGRDIFGGLVPYDKVWRTGANEATTFETNKSLKFRGESLPAGKYSLWTIPAEDHWKIIFNSEYGQWGINSKGEANRDPSRDVLSIDGNTMIQDREFEQFTIAFEPVGDDGEMVFMWDKTVVAVPFTVAQ